MIYILDFKQVSLLYSVIMVTIEHVHAASNQKRSRSGVMAKYMCESENIGYRTTRSNLRTVNGQGIDIALRNRGCMQVAIICIECFNLFWHMLSYYTIIEFSYVGIFL